MIDFPHLIFVWSKVTETIFNQKVRCHQWWWEWKNASYSRNVQHICRKYANWMRDLRLKECIRSEKRARRRQRKRKYSTAAQGHILRECCIIIIKSIAQHTFTLKSFTFSSLVFGFDFYSVCFFALHFVFFVNLTVGFFFCSLWSLPLPSKWWLYVFLYFFSSAFDFFCMSFIQPWRCKKEYFLTLATKRDSDEFFLFLFCLFWGQ